MWKWHQHTHTHCCSLPCPAGFATIKAVGQEQSWVAGTFYDGQRAHKEDWQASLGQGWPLGLQKTKKRKGGQAGRVTEGKGALTHLPRRQPFHFLPKDLSF